MKTLVSLAAVAGIIGSLGLAAAPAFAASTNTSRVPQCSGSADFTSFQYVDDALDDAGANVISTETWNGCIRAVYSIEGHTSMVFFDPNTLQVVGGTMPNVEG